MRARYTVQFDVSPYVRAHGTRPRGLGMWAFCASGLEDRADRSGVHVVTTYGDFTGAKRYARDQFAAMGVSRVAVLG